MHLWGHPINLAPPLNLNPTLCPSRGIWRVPAPKGQSTFKSVNDVPVPPNLDLLCWFPMPVIQLLCTWVLMVGSFGVGFWDWLYVSSSRGSKSSDPNPVTLQFLMVTTWFLQSCIPYLCSLTVAGTQPLFIFPETFQHLFSFQTWSTFGPWLPYHWEHWTPSPEWIFCLWTSA